MTTIAMEPQHDEVVAEQDISHDGSLSIIVPIAMAAVMFGAIGQASAQGGPNPCTPRTLTFTAPTQTSWVVGQSTPVSATYPILFLNSQTTYAAGPVGVCTIAPAGTTVTFVGEGICTVTASNIGGPDSVSAGGSCAASATLPLTVVGPFNKRKEVTASTGSFLTRRNNQVLTNEPSARRQVDRLVEACASADPDDQPPHQRFQCPPPELLPPPTGSGKIFKLSDDVDGAPRRAFVSPLAASGLTSRNTSDHAMNNPFMGQRRDYDALQDSRNAGAFSTASNGPFNFSGTVSGSQLMFSTSLRDLDKAAATAAYQNGAAFAEKPKARTVDVWMEARLSGFFHQVGETRDGTFGMLAVGMDYVISPRLLVGLYAQMDSTKQSFDNLKGEISGLGWMAGPYMTMRLSENVFWQARAGMGSSSNEISAVLINGKDEYASKRMMASTTLAGRWVFGAWSFRPTAQVSYIKDDADGYTDKAGVVIPAISSRQGQAKVGPELAVLIPINPTLAIEPRFGMSVINNFGGKAVAEDGSVIQGEANAQPTTRGRLELGLMVKTASGIIVDASTSYDGIGAQNYGAVSARATAIVPFK